MTFTDKRSSLLTILNYDCKKFLIRVPDCLCREKRIKIRSHKSGKIVIKIFLFVFQPNFIKLFCLLRNKLECFSETSILAQHLWAGLEPPSFSLSTTKVLGPARLQPAFKQQTYAKVCKSDNQHRLLLQSENYGKNNS